MFVQTPQVDAQGPLTNADPDQLLALAGYFERQAQWLRAQADAVRRRRRDSEAAQERYRASRAEFLRLGCLVAVLARRYGNREAAISQVRNRTGKSLEALNDAVAFWNKEKARRAKHKRDLQIYREDARGDRQTDIAARHRITARRVRDIVAAVSARLHRSALTRRAAFQLRELGTSA